MKRRHLALTLSGRLMGDLRAVIRVLIGAVKHRWHHRAPGGRVAAQLVGNQASRHVPLVLQSRAKEAHRGGPISSRLYEDVEDVTGLIHGAPQVLLATLDRDEHLVEMPGVSQPTAAAPQLPGVDRTEPLAPLPDGLIGDVDTPAGQHVLHVSEAEREAVSRPGGIAPLASRRTVREPLGSYRSPQANTPVIPQCQCANSPGRALAIRSKYCPALVFFPRKRAYLRMTQARRVWLKYLKNAYSADRLNRP